METIEPQIDLIKVRIAQDREIMADHADLFVTIKGSSYVTGDAALSKAREVSQLVEALRQTGLSEADIHLQDVVAEVSSGMLGRHSSASYHLKIRCPRLDLLPDVLGAITSQKNTNMGTTIWGYSHEKEQQEELLDTALQALKQKAQRMANNLGVRLLGISRLTEGYSSPERSDAMGATVYGAEQFQAARARSFDEELGLSPTHSKKLEVRVEADFRISGFDG